MFRDFQMECLRPCKPTPEWYDYMAARFTLEPFEAEGWKRGFGIFASNERRHAHNATMLALTSVELRTPIATINADHPYGGHAAITASPKKAQGLAQTLHVCVGSRVSLNWNGWVSRGVVNGLHGIVVEIVYEPGKAPPQLPLVVFVACPMYRGPSYDDEYMFEASEECARILGFAGLRGGQPGVIAVQPIGREFQAGKGNKTPCLRVQLPFELAWGITIHKSQSKTFGDNQEVKQVVSSNYIVSAIRAAAVIAAAVIATAVIAAADVATVVIAAVVVAAADVAAAVSSYSSISSSSSSYSRSSYSSSSYSNLILRMTGSRRFGYV